MAARQQTGRRGTKGQSGGARSSGRTRGQSTRRGAGGQSSRRGAKAQSSRRDAGAQTSRRRSGRAGARGGLTQKVQPDRALAEVVGSAPQPRTELVKKFWAYVRSHDLQAKDDRRKINADRKLQPLFGRKKQVTMFEVAQLITQHAR